MSSSDIPLDRAHVIAAKAITFGGTRASLARYEWDTSGSCENPVGVELMGRHDPKADKRSRSKIIGPGEGSAMRINIMAKCRKCPACLRARAAKWAHAAKLEIRLAPRTWFGTLTVRPEIHHHALSQARATSARKGTDFDTLSESEKFRTVAAQHSKELTRWLKRVRKNSGADMRYLLVTEAHKSGLPHWHILVHQRSLTPITYRHLTSTYDRGFVKFNLVDGDEKTAWYCCKYLTKSSLARVRASLQYGKY